MKKIIFSLLITGITFSCFSQFVARVEMKEDLAGICDKENVYSLLEMLSGQKEAVCVLKLSAIEKLLNDSVQFVKQNPDVEDKGMVSILINCKGVVVKCATDNKTKSPELDLQVLNIFKTLTFSKAGKLNGKNVDNKKLWSFEISKGKITLE